MLPLSEIRGLTRGRGSVRKPEAEGVCKAGVCMPSLASSPGKMNQRVTAPGRFERVSRFDNFYCESPVVSTGLSSFLRVPLAQPRRFGAGCVVHTNWTGWGPAHWVGGSRAKSYKPHRDGCRGRVNAAPGPPSQPASSQTRSRTGQWGACQMGIWWGMLSGPTPAGRWRVTGGNGLHTPKTTGIEAARKKQTKTNAWQHATPGVRSGDLCAASLPL